MAAQKGKDILLKIDDGTGAFITAGGIRSSTLAFNTETVDVTNADSVGRWRELLAGAGVRRASITGAGVFRDDATDAMVRTVFFNGDIRAWQITIPDFGRVQGAFQITALEYRGEHRGEVTFDLSLESAGSLTFTAI